MIDAVEVRNISREVQKQQFEAQVETRVNSLLREFVELANKGSDHHREFCYFIENRDNETIRIIMRLVAEKLRELGFEVGFLKGKEVNGYGDTAEALFMETSWENENF